MNNFKKYFKILALSIASLGLFIVINNSEKINEKIFLIQESRTYRAFGYFILFNIGKWFLFILGVVGLIYFLIHFVKRN